MPRMCMRMYKELLVPKSWTNFAANMRKTWRTTKKTLAMPTHSQRQEKTVLPAVQHKRPVSLALALGRRPRLVAGSSYE